MPPTKTSILLGHLRAGDWQRALSMAATFRMLPPEIMLAIRRGHAARTNPRLYAGMGEDPTQLVEAGRAALMTQWGARL